MRPATGIPISTMTFHLQLREPSGPKYTAQYGLIYAFIKGHVVDAIGHRNMDAVFPGLPEALGLKGFKPVGMCILGISPDRPLCTCPAGMSRDGTGANCTGTPGD